MAIRLGRVRKNRVVGLCRLSSIGKKVLCLKTSVKLFANPKTEAQHQMNVIRWSMAVRDTYPELCLLHHIPNGGARDQIEAKHLKDQGVKPGVPDLCLPVPRGQYHGMYIEMKTETGKPSLEQDWWVEEISRQGYFVEVCHGWRSAIRTIEWYLRLGVAT